MEPIEHDRNFQWTNFWANEFFYLYVLKSHRNWKWNLCFISFHCIEITSLLALFHAPEVDFDGCTGDSNTNEYDPNSSIIHFETTLFVLFLVFLRDGIFNFFNFFNQKSGSNKFFYIKINQSLGVHWLVWVTERQYSVWAHKRYGHWWNYITAQTPTHKHARINKHTSYTHTPMVVSHVSLWFCSKNC